MVHSTNQTIFKTVPSIRNDLIPHKRFSMSRCAKMKILQFLKFELNPLPNMHYYFLSRKLKEKALIITKTKGF